MDPVNGMWQFDVAINSVKTVLPFQATLRRLVRSRRGYPITANAPLALAQGLQQIHDLRGLGIELAGRIVLDFGTGWHPIVPLLYRAAGASFVHLTDMERLADPTSLATTVRWLSGQAADIAPKIGIEVEAFRRRLSVESGTIEQMLSMLDMRYHVPFWPENVPSVDLVVSRVVLEHVEPTALRQVHLEFAKALRPGGIVAHIVDNSDHREHRDKRLSRLDFLRFTERSWRMLCLNPQDYCNRLRHSDHKNLMSEAGFQLLFERGEIDTEALAAARTVALAPPWRDRPAADLAIMTSHLICCVARKDTGQRH
jgi:hypothetical protein